jgi:hypothetical protein
LPISKVTIRGIMNKVYTRHCGEVENRSGFMNKVCTSTRATVKISLEWTGSDVLSKFHEILRGAQDDTLEGVYMTPAVGREKGKILRLRLRMT